MKLKDLIPNDPTEIYDYEGNPVEHGRVTLNGVRLHYVIAGKGEPLLLLHGVPKTHFYWHKIIPILSEKYTVIAPDIRGFGDSGKPQSGYEMENIAKDLAMLMDYLGFETFFLHGEDCGAAFAYALAASYPERVRKLCYCEMLLPGYGLEDWARLEKDNVFSNHWLWHIVFFAVPDFPEFLIQGKEKEFWSLWMKNETYNPHGISDVAVNEFVRCCSTAGGLKPIFEVYRAAFPNMEYTARMAEKKLPMPIMCVASKHFIGEEGPNQMRRVSDNVTAKYLNCGHSLALECPEELANYLIDFMK